MLVVFIDEIGTGFAPYIKDVAEIFMTLTQFYASDNIRISSAGALSNFRFSAGTVYNSVHMVYVRRIYVQ